MACVARSEKYTNWKGKAVAQHKGLCQEEPEDYSPQQ